MASSSDPRNPPPPTNPSLKTLTTSTLPSPHPAATAPLNPSPAVFRQQSLSLPLMASKPSNLHRIQDPNPQFHPTPKVIAGPVITSRGYNPRNIRPQPHPHPQQFVPGGGGFQPRQVLPYPHNQVRGYGFDPHQQQVHMMRPPSLQPSQLGYRPNSAGLVKNIPSAGIHQKTAPFPSKSPDFDGLKRDKNRDDKFVTINDRKVQVIEDASLYTLCRSWVHNGSHQESQTQIVGGMKPLPRPKPSASGNTNVRKRNENGDEDEEDQEDEESVKHLSSREVLQRHIKRAKRVRARLREERKQRIERYKERLVHLLPSPVEEFRHDTAPGG